MARPPRSVPAASIHGWNDRLAPVISEPMAAEVDLPICFPAVALSPAGWIKCGSALGELIDASPSDDLSEWMNMRIVDANGATYCATRTFRAWPVTRAGLMLCKLFNEGITVGFELEQVAPMALVEFLDHPGVRGELPQGDWTSTRQVVDYLCWH